MQFHVVRGGIVITMIVLWLAPCRSEDNVPAILGGIENIANSATNFLTTAVEKPKNLIINATRITTGYIDSAASKGLDFKLRRFLEKFRGRMPYGIPELDIPPLEPFHLDEVDVEISNQDIGNVSVTIEDLTLYNLSTFVINKAKLSLIGPTITVNVTIPRIYAEGIYNISGILGFHVPLKGAGPFKANINNFQLYVNTVLGYSRGVYLKTFDIDFSLQNVDADLKNFMNDDELSRVMSKVFQELSPKAVDIIKPDILPTIKSDIGGRINETIHHLTMRDMISILVGYNEIREFAHLIVP